MYWNKVVYLVRYIDIFILNFYYNLLFVGCFLIFFIMLKNVYCIFDSYCLGVECCINVKFMMFLKVFKVWVRFDFCIILMKFIMVFENYKYEIDINLSI